MKARTKQTSDNARRDEPKQRNKQNKRGSLEGHEVGRLRLAVAGSGVDGQRQIKEPIAEGVGAADAQLVLVAFERVDQQNSVARRRRRRRCRGGAGGGRHRRRGRRRRVETVHRPAGDAHHLVRLASKVGPVRSACVR